MITLFVGSMKDARGIYLAVIGFLAILMAFPLGSRIIKSFQKKKEWITTEEGYKFWDYKPKGDVVFSWNGDTKGLLIHGTGILERYEDGEVKKSYLRTFYGSLSEEDWKQMPKAKYLGNYEDKKPEGLGVLIRGDVVDIGNFFKGELRGDITRFKGDHLLYRGGYKNGLYNGFGILYKKGEMSVGDFDDGYLDDGFFEGIGNEVSRLWNRVAGNKEKEADEKKDYYNFSREEFVKFMAEEVDKNMRALAHRTIEDRTDFWSLFRIFWQRIFTSKYDRTQGWMEAFENGGLGAVDIETFMNIYILDYNQNNIHGNYINPVKIKSFKKMEVLDKKTFDYINDLEVSKCQQNPLFDFVIVWIVSFVIGFVICLLIPSAIIGIFWVDVIVSIIFFIIGVVLAFVGDDITNDIIACLMTNYSKILENQGIFEQMLY